MKKNKIIQKEVLSVKEYAELIGITPAGVTKRIRNGSALQGIKSISTWGATYVLTVGDWSAIKKVR